MSITKKKIFSLFLLLSAFSFLFFISPVSVNEVYGQAGSTNLIDAQYGMEDVESAYGAKNQPKDIRIVVTRIIIFALQFLALIFLILVLFAGFQWMTSGGNEEKIKKAQALLKNAVIGLIIVLVAWSISRYLLTMFTKVIIKGSVDYTSYPY